MKKEVINLLFIIGLILGLGFISAGYELGKLSHSIEKTYGPSSYIKGWINISLEDEPTNSIFKDGAENSISLIDLLNINTDFEYTCNPLNCGTDYTESNPEVMKTFGLNEGNDILFGFRLDGKVISVNSINFTIESDVGSSCYSQIKMDLFSDEVIDFVNNRIEDSPPCGFLKSYGCFSEGETLGIIGTVPYCQRIKLSESPGFRLGAWVNNESSGNKKLTMGLYDDIGISIKQCTLPKEEIPAGGGEISCSINYSVTQVGDYYVCIYSDNGNGVYKIKGNLNPSTGCGFHGFPTLPETSAYQIFAEGKRFDIIGSLSLPDKNLLGEKAQEYLIEKYGVDPGEGYIDCSSGCIIPVKFISGKDQIVTIKDLIINHDVVGFSGAEETNFYVISESPASINSNFQKLYLNEGNFSVPSEFGNYTFVLSLGDIEILSEEVMVEKVPVITNLIPRTTASAYPTEFEVSVDSSSNITKYQWDFGDGGENKTTTNNKVTYTYDSTGTYVLKVTVTDSLQRSSSNTFEIEVNTPKEMINKFLNELQKDLENAKTQMKEFSLFIQDSLKSILDFDQLDKELTKIYKANLSASNESDYNKVMTDLLGLSEKVPKSIYISTSTDSFSIYPKEENINLDILKTIGGGTYDINNKEKYIESIFAWNQGNIESKVTFNKISAQYKYSNQFLLDTFELEINKKNQTVNPYFIIKDIKNLEFKEDYSEKKESEYVYIKLKDPQITIMFSSTEDISFIDLPFFISPGVNELAIEKSDEEIRAREKLIRLALLILIIFLLLIIGFAVYITLQIWYKKKYEDYLFKNKNSLYNLISYVQASKKKGLSDKEILIRLKKAGWKSEQINYIIKKYTGKRTGMLEIPIGKILNIFKKKKVKNIPRGPPRYLQRPGRFNNNNLRRGQRKRFF